MRRRANTWGGARAGAGRPKRGPIASEPHKQRPRLSARHPVHVTARLVPLALARGQTYRVLERALALALGRPDFRIVHIALVRSRSRSSSARTVSQAMRSTDQLRRSRALWSLELVVEADDMHALARGMQGFQVSAAKAVNRSARRRGTVFPDRYRMRILATRVAVRALVGALPLARTDAWPQTWLLRIEAPARVVRRWIHSRADEDS